MARNEYSFGVLNVSDIKVVGNFPGLLSEKPKVNQVIWGQKHKYIYILYIAEIQRDFSLHS